MFSQINKRTLQKNPCTLGISEKTSTHCTHAIKKPFSKSHPLKLSPLLKHVYIILQSCVRMLKVTIHKFIFHLIIKSFFPVCVAHLKKKKRKEILTNLIIFSCVALFIGSVWTGKKAQFKNDSLKHINNLLLGIPKMLFNIIVS